MKVTIFLGATLTTALIWVSGWGSVIWLTGTKALPENVGFGYYRDFSLARSAIEESGCPESIEYSRHEDISLESFHFRIRTRSGLIVRLWFNDGMDVRQVCSKPVGFVVLNPISQALSQSYSVDELATSLTAKGIRVENLADVLCNLEELALVFEANYNKQEIRRITHNDEDINRRLHIEILDQERANDFVYSRIR